MGAYYPSLVVNLKLRFDAEVLRALEADAPGATPEQMAKAPDGPPGAGQAPRILRVDPPYSFITGRVPVKASVDLPGYRTAATFDCEFPFRDLPIDPQTVKAAAVEIYLGTVSPLAMGTAADPGAETVKLFGRQSVLRVRDSLGRAIDENLVMVGTVDTWKVSHGASGSTAHLHGRDLRAILIDTPVALLPGEAEAFFDRIDMEGSIVEVVRAILGQHPLMADVRVVANAEEWDGGKIPSPASSAATPRHRKGAKGTKGRPASAGQGDVPHLSYWDLIVRECYLVGAIPHWVGLEVHVRPAAALFSQLRQGIDPRARPTPFAGGRQRTRDAASGQAMPPLAVRKLVYGRDVKELSFDRKYGGYQKPKIVRVVTVDDSAPTRGEDRLLVGRWPPEEASAKVGVKPSPGEALAQKEILNIPVAGVRDKARLARIARAVFEEIGRGEMGGSCSTPNLASFGGDNEDPDLLRLRPGDGVEFAVDTRVLGPVSPLISTLTDTIRRPMGEMVAELTVALGDNTLARAVVAGARSTRAQRFFRVSSVKFDWAASGVKVAFDFQNYVVAADETGEMSSAPGRAVAVSVPKKLLPALE